MGPALLVLICWCCCALPLVQAQESAPPANGRTYDVEPVSRPGEIYVLPPARQKMAEENRSDIRKRVAKVWDNRKTAVQETGDYDTGPASLDTLLDILQQQGYSSVSGLEANLVHEAHLLTERKHLEQARRSLDAALTLNPVHLPSLSAKAEISLGRTPFSAPGYIAASLSALNRTFWPALTSLVNLSLVLALTLAVMTCLLQLVIAARYQKLLRHSVSEAWRERIPGSLLPMFGWFLLLAPLLLCFGPFWLFCCWTAMFWRFATRVERLLALASLLFLAFLVPAVDTVVGTYRDLSTDDLRLFSEALQNKLLSPRGEALLREGASEPEQENRLGYRQEQTFLVAGIHRRMGRDDEAFQSYASIPVYHYLYPMAQNNIGNIYFSMHQFDLATQHYRAAIDIRPQYAECHFNLSNAQFQVYDFDHSDQSLSRAQRLAPLAIGKLISEEARGLRTLDHQIPPSFLWELAWDALRVNARRHFAGLGRVIPGVRSSSRGGGILILPVAALLSALLGLLLGWICRHERIGRCSSCGRAYCRHCGPDPVKQPHCQQCAQLDSRRSGISPGIKKRKLDQIRRHRLWRILREALLTLSIPGLESMRGGRTLTGGLVAGSWIFLITVILALPRYLPHIGLRSPSWSLDPLVLVAGILAALLWGASLVSWVVQVLRSGSWRFMGTLRLAPGQPRDGGDEGGD